MTDQLDDDPMKMVNELKQFLAEFEEVVKPQDDKNKPEVKE